MGGGKRKPARIAAAGKVAAAAGIFAAGAAAGISAYMFFSKPKPPPEPPAKPVAAVPVDMPNKKELPKPPAQKQQVPAKPAEGRPKPPEIQRPGKRMPPEIEKPGKKKPLEIKKPPEKPPLILHPSESKPVPVQLTGEQMLYTVPAEHRQAASIMLYSLKDKGATPQQEVSFIASINTVISQTGENAADALDFFSRTVYNKQVRPYAYGEEFAREFALLYNKFTEKSESHDFSMLQMQASLDFRYMLSNASLGTSTFRALRYILDNGIGDGLGAFKYACFAFRRNPRFTPEKINDDFAVQFTKSANFIALQPDGFPSPFRIFKGACGNPYLTPDTLTYDLIKRLINLTEYISSLCPYSSYGEDVWVNIIDETDITNLTMERIDEGMGLAASFGFDGFEMQLNFAYGESVLGEDGVRTLHNECGIVHFARFPGKVLEEAYASMDPEYKKGSPTLAVMFAREDWNGSFYVIPENLDKLAETHRVAVAEVHNAPSFRDSIELMSEHNKIDTLIITGHGYPKSIFLGSGKISTSQYNMLAGLKGNFSENPKVVLNSCSTGKNSKSIAAVLSEAWGVTVWAPKKSIWFTHIRVDDNGNLIEVACENILDGINKFQNGAIVD